MQKDFLTITPDSGGGGSQEVTVAVPANTGNARSSTITIQGGGITRTIDVNQEATKYWYLTFQVREVISGSDGNWDIEIQYKTTDGNIRSFPNHDEFDVVVYFTYEDANDKVISVPDAILDTYTPSEWMDKIGEDWQASFFGNVSSGYQGSPMVAFSSIHSTASPSVDVSM